MHLDVFRVRGSSYQISIFILNEESSISLQEYFFYLLFILNFKSLFDFIVNLLLFKLDLKDYNFLFKDNYKLLQIAVMFLFLDKVK